MSLHANDNHGSTHPRRAVGIIRVSQVGGRAGESFISPEQQRERLEAACERDGLDLIRVIPELDVSGGLPLDERPGLSEAVVAIERGEATVVVAAYFDRLFRSLGTQAEVVDRVEKAGGQVLAVDVGLVSGATAGQWLSANMLGIVSEYVRRSMKERTAGAQERAVARGAWPVGRVPLGYVRNPDGTLGVDPDQSMVALVRDAYRMRADGQTIPAIRDYLFSRGVDRTDRGVQQMLMQRVYLGEIHWGQHVNRNACDPIIDRDLFDTVQRIKVPRGRRPRSDRLLARQGILRCGVCGSRLSVDNGNVRHGGSAVYRCVPHGNHRCPSPVAITATIAEQKVVTAARDALSNAQGRATAVDGAQAAIAELQTTQQALDAAVRSFAASGLADEPSAVDRLSELRESRDVAQAAVDRIGHGATATMTVAAADDWDELTLDERRAILRAVVAEAVVMPHAGRRRWDGGADRIVVKLVGE